MALSEAEELELLELEEAEYQSSKAAGPSSLASAGRGFAQGSTAGFSDEGGAGIYAAAEKYLPESIQTMISGRNPNLEYQPTKESFSDVYKNYRDTDRKANQVAKDANPGAYLGGEIAGAVSSNFVPGVSSLKGVGQGALAGAGYSEADNFGDLASDTLIGAGAGAAFDLGGKALSYGAQKAAPYVERAGEKIKRVADDFYLKATGATGRQAEKFSPDAPEVLREYVKFGDSPENIANRLQGKIDESGSRIGSALDEATDKGAKVDLVKYLEDAEAKIAELNAAGNLSEAAALEAQTTQLIDRANKMGVTEVTPSFMENVKRESQSGINYFADTKPAVAGKKLGASMQRQAVEDSVSGYSDDLGREFTEQKKLFGVLSPIQEAAEKRASTLNQSPFGGLGDTAAQAMGMIPGGSTMTGLATAAGRRMIAPRLASSAAVSFDKIGDIVKASPQLFGKYASVLQGASQRGPGAVASTHFLLQQSDPGYRAVLNKVAGIEPEEGSGF